MAARCGARRGAGRAGLGAAGLAAGARAGRRPAVAARAAEEGEEGGFWVVPGYRVTGIHEKKADGSYALRSNWFKDFSKPSNWDGFNKNTAGGSGDSSATGQGNIAFAALLAAGAAFYYQGGGANTTAMAWLLVPSLVLVLRGSREGPGGYKKPTYGKAFVPFGRSPEEGKKSEE